MQTKFRTDLLEIKLFRIGGWVSLFGALFLLSLDSFVFKVHTSIIVEVGAVIIFSRFVYLAYNKPTQKNRHLFLFAVLLVVNTAFFIEKGWATPSSVLFFICILYGTILVNSKYAKIMVAIFFVDFIFLTISEYFLFKVPMYASHQIEEIQAIHNVYSILGITVTVYLVGYFKSMYDKERYSLNTINYKLDMANEKLSIKNTTLLSSQKEIQDKKDLLEDNREKLIDANNQIGKLNIYLNETVVKRKTELAKINKELSLLFYRSSHDFRRPLTTLKGLALVSKLTTQQDMPKHILELVDKTAETMNRMLDKFLMLYQINDLPRYPNTSWDDIRKNISKIVSDISTIDFSCDIETEFYNSDDRRNFLVDIIIKNLVENCCFHRDFEERTKVQVKINEIEGKVHLSVWDDGKGIPEEIKDKIFDIYFRGSNLSNGNGLGLYVVQSAVKKLNGNINVSSRENEFTQFDITFSI